MPASRSSRQTTLADRVGLSGIGVHSGKPVTVTLHPADADSGIVFLRTNLPGCRDAEIPALFEAVSATDLSTVLGELTSASVATVEHMLAAFRGLGLDNVTVEIDGPEAPIMDGSAADFVAAIDQVGLETLESPRRYLKVLKPVRVEQGASWAELSPYGASRFDIAIDFASPLIGRQRLALDLDPATFRREVARARTFGFLSDVEKLWAAGYALGSSLDNSVVLGEDRIVNPEGLRYPDEFVRHKMLDAIGDLALAGAPILGCYRSHRGGHRLNHAMLAALFADPEAFSFVEAPARRESEQHEATAALAAAAFSPEVS